MYIYSTQPAQRVLGEPSPTVTSVPLTKVFGTGVTATFPFSAVCRIEVRTGKGNTSVGSGVLISRHHVLTCAHVLYDRADPDPRKLTVLPNHDGADEKRKAILADTWAVKPSWTWRECRTADDDLAIIRLNHKADADFWPIQNFNPSIIGSGPITLAGYPAFSKTDKAYLMYRSEGSVLGGLLCPYGTLLSDLRLKPRYILFVGSRGNRLDDRDRRMARDFVEELADRKLNKATPGVLVSGITHGSRIVDVGQERTMRVRLEDAGFKILGARLATNDIDRASIKIGKPKRTDKVWPVGETQKDSNAMHLFGPRDFDLRLHGGVDERLAVRTRDR